MVILSHLKKYTWNSCIIVFTWYSKVLSTMAMSKTPVHFGTFLQLHISMPTSAVVHYHLNTAVRSWTGWPEKPLHYGSLWSQYVDLHQPSGWLTEYKHHPDSADITKQNKIRVRSSHTSTHNISSYRTTASNIMDECLHRDTNLSVHLFQIGLIQ